MITPDLQGDSMKGFILLFIIACFTFSVNLKANVMFNRYVPEEYVVIAEDILADMAEKLPKRHNMIVIGTGGGLAKRVNVLSLSFEIQGPQSKEKLREILIDCVEEFLLALNSNEKLRPHLKTYPFTSQGINIVIFVTECKETASPRSKYWSSFVQGMEELNITLSKKILMVTRIR